MAPKKRAAQEPDDFEDVAFDDVAEEGDDAFARCQRKLANAKEALAVCQKERQEYLDGWQRLRADVANMKKEHSGSGDRALQTAREQILADLLPVLDSFEMAFNGEAWEQVDPAWRQGVEYIYSQFQSVLARHGAHAFGETGEAFDPHAHEAASEEPCEEEEKDDTIARVLQRGYMIGTKVIRPARVVLYRCRQ